MKQVTLLAAAAVVLVMGTSGCATIFNGSTETIHVRSEEPDTRFFMNQRDLGRGTSAVVTVPKKDLGRAVLRSVKEGCNERSVPIPTSFDGVSLLGVFLDFGIISIVVVDWLATGAVNKAAQTDFVLTPECADEMSQLLFKMRYAPQHLVEGRDYVWEGTAE